MFDFKLFTLFVLTAFVWGSNADYGVPKYLQNKYGSNLGPAPPPEPYYATKTNTKTKTANQGTPKLECKSQPPTPINAGIRCSKYSGCRADCLPNFQYPNGATTLTILCIEGKWELQNFDWPTIPSCEPICEPQCENNGICIAPNECTCPENYSGPQCQLETKPCLNYPPMPQNAKRACNAQTCSITCLPGHQFADGSSITSSVCKNGVWKPIKEKWQTIPDCMATCNPSCQNGGVCLSFNVCQCPQEYRGSLCQYPASNCVPKRLNFNGGYNCSGDAESFSCSLNCPAGVTFEFQPLPAYRCLYETGIFAPQPVPQCVFPALSNTYYTSYNSSNHISHQYGYGKYNLTSITYPHETSIEKTNFIPLNENHQSGNIVFMEKMKPSKGVCITWQGIHYKTFDSKVLSFESKCPFTLVRDSIDNSFAIIIQNDQTCQIDQSSCSRLIKIYYQGKEFILQRVNNRPTLRDSLKKHPLAIPGQVPGLRTVVEAHYIVLNLDTIGVTVKWDGKLLVQVEVQENLWERTEGLCGKLDGNEANDYVEKSGITPVTVSNFATSWQVDDFEQTCADLPQADDSCSGHPSLVNEALDFCNHLLNDQLFQHCHRALNVDSLLSACRSDYCACQEYDRGKCACETLNVLIRTCAFTGLEIAQDWRDATLCPLTCPNGRTYRACQPQTGVETCGASVERQSATVCIEGCYCPTGTVLHNETCIEPEACPCKLRGRSFPAGATIPKECNTCACTNGEWICTRASCGARCAAVGDPHYVTFDGRTFDFMGQCSYTLVKAATFAIEAENVACAGAISASMNLPRSLAVGLPSCTRTVTIRTEGHAIKLKQNHELVVDGYDVVQVPRQVGNSTIRTVSSLFLQVELPGQVLVWWDGQTRLYVDIPPEFEHTRGLCGSYNGNQKDDFLTPDGDIETNTIPFANKWKTAETCADIRNEVAPHPCDLNLQNKPKADRHCALLKSALFAACHFFVDPETHHKNCLFDVCSCESNVAKCLCPTLSNYAAECARKGVNVEWRGKVRECGLTCPKGQTYQVCGNSCTRSCLDYATRSACKPQCVEGCNCKVGEALDASGECVPIGECKCQQDGLEFYPGYKEVRPASKGPQLCTCTNARWTCRLAHPAEIDAYPKANDLKSLCASAENLQFTTCESIEPVTCKNMHKPHDAVGTLVCHAGCTCATGFVLDSTSRKCVRPVDCPCHHGGRSYKENATIKNDCNTCRCTHGKWICEMKRCSGECSVFGDSHYQTFDGKRFDYQGQCDYVLAKGSLDGNTFDVTVQSVPCGSLGTACSKSVTVRVTVQDEHETITVSKSNLKQNFKHAIVREAGLFLIVDIPDLGVVVQWDGGTRVYVRIDTKWNSKVKGLCGNFNGDESDDFQTPSGGVVEVSALIFGDSWKLQDYCPEAETVGDACEGRPERRLWAVQKCGVLKTALFSACHSEVAIDYWFSKCVFDSCACDKGGDCQCLCTSLAAYAQECNSRGVGVKWRSQELCPMQCDERCTTYVPCISTCTLETCDNLLAHDQRSKTCGEEPCIEGCAPKRCPPDHIHLNSSYFECVPRNICKPICLELNNVLYYEGDLIEQDDCHRCFCSRGHQVCKGQPCPTSSIPSQLEQELKCQSGWTKWLNQDKAVTKSKSRGKKSDIEPLPPTILLNGLKGAKCDQTKMTNIECRTVKTHLTPKETGLDVECSLENGLICQTDGQTFCKDFEIRVYCECEPKTTPAPICDPTHPHKEHPTDCHKFYHCDITISGPQYVEKTCGPSMYYNPVSMTCDWPYAVAEIKPECKKHKTSTSPPLEVPQEVSLCPPGQTYDSCAIKCTNLCLYYAYVVSKDGKCQNNEICDSDCTTRDVTCPDGQLYANNETCVSLHDCSCKSYDNRPVQPGVVYRESDCKVCQCIDNYYVCDDSACHTTTQPPITKPDPFGNLEKLVVPTILNTVTPPEACESYRFVNLVPKLGDEAFNASSTLGRAFKPQFAKFCDEVPKDSAGSWSPEYANMDQYLDINLGQQEPIYGLKIKGSPLYNEFVTSFKVFYSPSGTTTFIPVLNDERLPQIFRGSVDPTGEVRQIFVVPFEAQVVRINPQTWQNGISLRVELLGCDYSSTTPAYEWITVATVRKCDDAMGLEDGTLSIGQVSVSSELNRNTTKYHLKLNENGGWQPLTNSPTEFVQFDFLEARNITGLSTKGGQNGWVSAYIIKYSHDGTVWNPIIDKTTLKEHVFLGNNNENKVQKNTFDLPISTKFIRVVPTKWEQNIVLQVEIFGCFKPYPISEVETTILPTSTTCNVCPGVSSEPLEMQACHCADELYWNGKECTERKHCSCVDNGVSYTIGAIYQKEDCNECLCKIGGTSYCHPKKCPACKDGLKSTVTATCKCSCQVCPTGTTLCRTSNICIDSSLWCNGVQDCPDDETNCIVKEVVKDVQSELVKKCLVPDCPPGYKREERKVAKSNSYLSPMFTNQGTKSVKSSYNPIRTNYVKKSTLQKPIMSKFGEVPCPEFYCVSEKPPPKFTYIKECPPVSCPLNFIPILEPNDDYESNECPKYICNPPPPPDAVCNITGRTFNTFDHTEYKYDICNHILARDFVNDEWDISLRKQCKPDCIQLVIINHETNHLVIYPDHKIEYDNFVYTIDQTKNIGSKSQAFTIQQLGTNLLFVSNRYGFWLIIDQNDKIKLGVVRKLAGTIDGLCGFFNDAPGDDKRKPDGTQARTSAEFGSSWLLENAQCTIEPCPLEIEQKAWEICNSVKDQALGPCARVVDIEAFISRCLEATTSCLQKSTRVEECRCNSLQDFVVDCLIGEPTVELNDWRMRLDCPVSCDSPLVHHDCYQRKCEPSCESVQDSTICPKLANVCFPGCYCPNGFVKKGNACIKPSACRDCECNVLPHLKYVTYDNTNFTINGNCVYVMSRDVVQENEKHQFQVLITNAPCRSNELKTCVGKVTILYEGHKIHVLNNMLLNKLRLVVDGERIDDIDEELKWGQVRETSTKHYKILLSGVQVEVSVYYPSLGVSVKAPSHRYASKLEGLCGNCNKNPKDDLQLPTGDLTTNIDEFGLGWLYDKLPGGQSREQCHNQPLEVCKFVAPELDPCSQIFDYNKFGQCLQVNDPGLFVEWCQRDTCNNRPELSCTAIEAFARDCASVGFCVNWRNELCPKRCPLDQVYNACGSSCPASCDKMVKKCAMVPVEGCFCPEGKVLRNETCVTPDGCKVCDDAGHKPGDKWMEDKCTSCECDGVSRKCAVERCASGTTVCDKGYQPLRLQGRDECCPRFICVVEPTVGPTCEPPQALNCGVGQVLKLDTKPNGCQQFICECRPYDECEPIDTPQPLQVGFERQLDESGCCPFIRLVCNVALCPRAEPCPPYYRLRNETGKCCPVYACEPPQRECVFGALFTEAAGGGERARTALERQTLLMGANATWRDGPCRECRCALTALNTYQAECTQIECTAIETSPDYVAYELEPVYVRGKCCAEPKRVACRHNNKVHKIGEKWSKVDDFCTTFECINSTNGVVQEQNVQKCETSCKLGSEYVPAELTSKQCCGFCKPVACVNEGVIYKVGDNWQSDDYCTDYFCLSANGSMQIESVKVNCPRLPDDFNESFVYEAVSVKEECCKKYEMKACKVDGKVYEVGQSWQVGKCKTVTCSRKHDEIYKQETVETCNTNCSLGWEYKASEEKCCGKCVQVACLVDNKLKHPNQNWTSNDNCTTFTCEVLNDQFVVSSHQESCPTLDNCPKERIYTKGCCKHCKLAPASQSACIPKAVPLNKTIGLIGVHQGVHGICQNKKAIENFNECVGNCDSSTSFNYKSGVYENVCSCCQTTETNDTEVELTCEDDYIFKKKIPIPSSCGCEGCTHT